MKSVKQKMVNMRLNEAMFSGHFLSLFVTMSAL